MALDRQKILSELGNVMNQLKSTDCGCMGNLFGDSGQNVTQAGKPSTYGGYRQGCCHGHYVCNSTPNNIQNSHRTCMGQYDPPKLYSDTYNYLNENLMKPTINEVYNELKDITPANTVINNPLAKQIGFCDGQLGQSTINPSPIERYSIDNGLNSGDNAVSTFTTPKNINRIGGMGPQILNMFGENHTSKPSNVQQITPASNQLNYSEGSGHMEQSYLNTNPILSQQLTPNSDHLHGRHAQGIAKFNQIFPDTMKKDLGFDPMAIAIQMNPANQNQAAFNKIHKILDNNTANNGVSTAFNTNVISAGLEPSIINNNKQYGDNEMSNEILNSNVLNQQSNLQNLTRQQEIYNIANLNKQMVPCQQASQLSGNIYDPLPHSKQPNHNGYAALKNTSFDNQHQQPIYDFQSKTDPRQFNTIATPIIYEESFIPNKLQNVSGTPSIKPRIKEPILPSDSSKFVMPKQKYCHEFNTLGQPIEMLPAKIYQTPEPNLPQTLSPQVALKSRDDFAKFSNVKATISKTSLMGSKPVGKTPSRNQLQQIYNQYKGSQSYTNQSLKDQFNQNVNNSDGRLKVPIVNTTVHKLPIESVGGDTAANNRLYDELNHKVPRVTEQIGDGPIYKQTSNLPEKLSPAVTRKCRNGLQDIVYTSYPTSAAWSFHGHGRAIPYTSRYRYRNKI